MGRIANTISVDKLDPGRFSDAGSAVGIVSLVQDELYVASVHLVLEIAGQADIDRHWCNSVRAGTVRVGEGQHDRTRRTSLRSALLGRSNAQQGDYDGQYAPSRSAEHSLAGKGYVSNTRVQAGMNL